MITAVISKTEDGRAVALLQEDGSIILKAYLNPERTKIRIVLPELRSMGQTRIDDQHHFLEFDRKATR